MAAMLPPLVVALLFIGALRGLNALPLLATALSGPPVPPIAEGLEYENLRQAERALEVKLLLPSYLPSDLRWPPVVVRGTMTNQRSISYLLLSSDGSRSLLVREDYSEVTPSCGGAAATIILRDAQACLESTKTPTGRVTRRHRWSAGDRGLELHGTYSPDDLVRIALSVPG
ncbi:MAG: hypothetical protein ACYC4L_09330 [Chloroflexota bacterium]